MARYCGRDFTPDQIDLLRRLIAEDPARRRAELSRLACQHLDWTKPDGGLKDMSCRVAMLRMHRDGLIQLPPPRHKTSTPRIRPSQRSDPQTPIRLPVHQLPPVQLQPVTRGAASALWNEYIERYHYLGYQTLPGAQYRYIASAGQHIVGLLGFGAAAWKTAPRDRLIGWTQQQRQHNLHRVVNNARFLILPWVQSKNLASRLLAMAARQLHEHWQQRYGYRPVLLETFVETRRFKGTCYKAANWTHVGQTKGRGKLDRHRKAQLPIKDVWIYPLDTDFKRLLCQ